MGSFRLHRAFLFTLTGSLVIAAGMGLFGLAVEFRFGRLGDRALQTALSVALFSLTSFGCAIAWERDRWRVVAVIGIVCSVLSIPVYMLGIWIRWGGPYWEPIFKTMAMMATWCVLLAHMCLLTLARPKRGWRWTVRWTRVCAVLLGLGISAMIIIDPGYPTGEVCARVLGGLAILTACGTVCVPILHLSALHTVSTGHSRPIQVPQLRAQVPHRNRRSSLHQMRLCAVHAHLGPLSGVRHAHSARSGKRGYDRKWHTGLSERTGTGCDVSAPAS